MTTATILAVFEDFNDLEGVPVEPRLDVDVLSADMGEIREEAWTDGYLTGRQQRDTQDSDQLIAAKLLTSLHELEGRTSDAVDAAALMVADLLVSSVITATADGWSANLMDRVRSVADRIRPALTLAPEFILRADGGATQHFGSMSDLSRALEEGAGEDVTIRWQHGEATISRNALLEDLREAITPLSAGLVDRQNARQQA